MAHLDVRERRIEATIAYLGPDLAGRSTNLLHLGGGDRAPGGVDDALAIEWRPIGLDRFDDCDVSVRLVAPRGALESEDVRRAVQDADGVVLVLDADPAARERNLRWMDPARRLLAPGALRPVVVQLNKSDLTEPDTIATLVQLLDLGGWPHVVASASRGEGVVETVRCALDRVLDGLAGGNGDGPAREHPPANPLLTALRQVLRESIDERVAAIEERIVRRVTEHADQASHALRVELAAVASGAGDTCKRADLEAVEARLRDAASAAERRLEDAVSAAEARLRDAVGAAARAEREHLAASLLATRRALDAVKVDLRPIDHAPELRATAERLQKLTERLDEAFAVVVPTAAAVRTLPLRFGEAHDRTRNVVLRSIEEVGGRVDASIAGLNVEGGALWTRIDARTEKVEAAVEELLEELKKRKKGWFG